MAVDLNSLENKLAALTDLGVKKALAKGAEEAEVFASFTDITRIDVKTAIIEASQGAPSGIGIRVVVDGKVGFSATSGIDEAQIGQVAEEAVAVARIRPLDPAFKHLPDPVKRSSKNGIIDDRVLGFSETEALNEVSMLAKRTFEYDKRIKSLWGGVEVCRGTFAVSNSRGLMSCAKGAYIGAGVYCVAMKNGKQKTGSEDITSRKLTDFSEVGTKAADRAVKMLEAKPLGKSLKTPTVWENRAIGYLFWNMLNTATNAQNVQEGRSYFKGKIGSKVASSIITVVDDGQLPEGLSTQKIDAEGVPMRKTMLIEKGVLKSFLYDNYAALRENKESTGNAKRQTTSNEPFLATPTVSTTNLVVEPGGKTLEGLVAEVDKGVLITDFVMGVGHANRITGEFSVVAPSAFLVEKGEIVHPLEPLTVAGNFFHALKKVQAIGCDIHLLEIGKIPSIVIEDLTVSG